MVRHCDGCEATLGCPLQRDFSSVVLDGYDDSVGGVGACFSHIQHICGQKADLGEREEGQPSHVLKDVDRHTSVMQSREYGDGTNATNEKPIEGGKSAEHERRFEVREKSGTGRFGAFISINYSHEKTTEDFERCFISCMMRETSTAVMREFIDTVSEAPSGTGQSIILLHVQK